MLGFVRRFVIVIALVGCRDKGIEELRAIKAEVCACDNEECGEKAMKKIPQHGVAANHHAQKIANEMLACMFKLHLKARPVTDPDRETGSATSPGSADPASARTP